MEYFQVCLCNQWRSEEGISTISIEDNFLPKLLNTVIDYHYYSAIFESAVGHEPAEIFPMCH